MLFCAQCLYTCSPQPRMSPCTPRTTAVGILGERVSNTSRASSRHSRHNYYYMCMCSCTTTRLRITKMLAGYSCTWRQYAVCRALVPLRSVPPPVHRPIDEAQTLSAIADERGLSDVDDGPPGVPRGRSCGARAARRACWCTRNAARTRERRRRCARDAGLRGVHVRRLEAWQEACVEAARADLAATGRAAAAAAQAEAAAANEATALAARASLRARVHAAMRGAWREQRARATRRARRGGSQVAKDDKRHAARRAAAAGGGGDGDGAAAATGEDGDCNSGVVLETGDDDGVEAAAGGSGGDSSGPLPRAQPLSPRPLSSPPLTPSRLSPASPLSPVSPLSPISALSTPRLLSALTASACADGGAAVTGAGSACADERPPGEAAGSGAGSDGGAEMAMQTDEAARAIQVDDAACDGARGAAAPALGDGGGMCGDDGASGSARPPRKRVASFWGCVVRYSGLPSTTLRASARRVERDDDTNEECVARCVPPVPGGIGERCRSHVTGRH